MTPLDDDGQRVRSELNRILERSRRRAALAPGPIHLGPEGPLMQDDTADRSGQATERVSPVRRGRGPQKAPTKVPVTIRLDKDLVDHLRAGGRGWQTRLNEMLRDICLESAAEEPFDQPEQDHRADHRDHKRTDKARGTDAHETAKPAAEIGTENPDNEVLQKTVISFHQFLGNPAGQKTDDKECEPAKSHG